MCDVAVVLAFAGLRWEEAVAVLIDSVNLDGQSMIIDRTASESGGRRPGAPSPSRRSPSPRYCGAAGA